jgi:hypothetical protein
LAKLNVPPQVLQALAKERINLAAAKVPENTSKQLKNALEQAIALSYVDSFRLIMFIAAALAITSALIAFFTIEERQKTL